jgi:hypothetical protein
VKEPAWQRYAVWHDRIGRIIQIASDDRQDLRFVYPVVAARKNAAFAVWVEPARRRSLRACFRSLVGYGCRLRQCEGRRPRWRRKGAMGCGDVDEVLQSRVGAMGKPLSSQKETPSGCPRGSLCLVAYVVRRCRMCPYWRRNVSVRNVPSDTEMCQ